MRRFPEPIHNAPAALSRLPGVGPKTALRYVFYLLKQPKHEINNIARAIVSLTESVYTCQKCFAYSDRTTCFICDDKKRDQDILCIIEESRDIAIIEASGAFKGLYHVLGGTLNPIEGYTPDMLRISELEKRLSNHSNINEVILALSPNVHGEGTMLYLMKRLAPLKRKTTRLARGLPIGATLEYADEITLGDAFTGRRSA